MDLSHTQQFTLQAMAENYSPGCTIDKLDLEVFANAAKEIAALREILRHLSPQEPIGTAYRIEHDGFAGTVQGYYKTREGKKAVVLQQHGTKVVHVYGRQWLKPDDNKGH